MTSVAQPSSKISAAPVQRVGLFTVALWLLVALLDGFDLQSAGIAAPGIVKEFGFNPALMGWVLSLSTAGIAVGAGLGGWIADRAGRKTVLVWSALLFGVFSVATARSWDFNSLVAARFFTGLGLGAAMPNLVALVAESSNPKHRNRMVGMVYCGMPIGAASAAAVGYFFVADYGWRIVFYIGGFGPIAVALLLALFLRESPEFGRSREQAASQRTPALRALFGEGRAGITLALWLASFFTLTVHYLLLNWLPSILIARGFTPTAASAIQVAYNLGGVPGMLGTGLLMDRRSRLFGVALIYVALIAVLVGISTINAPLPLVAIVFAADLCTSAALIVLYALPLERYDVSSRATGVGATIAWGRAGAFTGPWAAGQLLAIGMTSGTILLLGIPGLAVAAVALAGILSRPRKP